MAVSKTILKTTREFRVNTDEEAKKLIAEETELAIQNGYSVIKASYDYKEKRRISVVFLFLKEIASGKIYKRRICGMEAGFYV